MLEHGLAACALFVNQVWRLFLNDLSLDRIQKRDFGLRLEIEVSALLLLDQMLVRLCKVLRTVEVHEPVLPLLSVLLLDPLDEVGLELLDIMGIIVLVSFPDELVVDLLNVGRDVAHLHEGEDRPLDQVQIDHLVVAVLRHLVQDRAPHAVRHVAKALISEQDQGCGRKAHGVVVLEIVAVLRWS